jgi:hypothetical protein
MWLRLSIKALAWRELSPDDSALICNQNGLAEWEPVI